MGYIQEVVVNGIGFVDGSRMEVVYNGKNYTI